MQLFALTFFMDRLAAPYWPIIVLVCFCIAAFSFLIPSRFWYIRVPAFLTVGFLSSVFFVGFYVDHERNVAVTRSNADRSFQNPFYLSVRNAPRELQFFLHAAALKNCQPYGWSYRTMGFYPIPRSAAVNVLPVEWRKLCNITNEY